MEFVHLHLILNHLPATGVLIAVGILAVGRLQRNSHFQRIALALLLVSGLATIPAYLTGGSAEHAVKGMPGVSKSLIEAHEDAAGVAFAAVEVLAGVSLLGRVLFRRSEIPKYFAVGLLVMAISTTGLFAWTGYLGGQIRHPEIRSDAQVASATQDEQRAELRRVED